MGLAWGLRGVSNCEELGYADRRRGITIEFFFNKFKRNEMGSSQTLIDNLIV
mgnify:CR=1 FL=1